MVLAEMVVSPVMICNPAHLILSVTVTGNPSHDDRKLDGSICQVTSSAISKSDPGYGDLHDHRERYLCD